MSWVVYDREAGRIQFEWSGIEGRLICSAFKAVAIDRANLDVVPLESVPADEAFEWRERYYESGCDTELIHYEGHWHNLPDDELERHYADWDLHMAGLHA